ncbi:hypothetical protein B296_00049944 [Ensete ventricosum]|uniref:Protein kinase domain-containing protein n=1 Tax=Ensete ventricosum TaxID=4639 RepID=A0A426X0B2_ENSVE|nr:hypothetical protein B296_00049944 [Ensete ventricosum]
MILESGPQGTIYKARFPNGLVGAVKRVRSQQLGKDTFFENVQLLGRLHHRHLVRLKGFSEGKYRYVPLEFSCHGILRFLVFDYTENGSLKDYLHVEKIMLSFMFQLSDVGFIDSDFNCSSESNRKRETCVAFEPQIGDPFDLASVKEIDGIMRIAVAVVVVLLAATAEAGDQNDVFTPCDDAKIQRWDGFTFGIAFSNHDSFFSDGVQLSPCDSRLSLTSVAQLAVFRPKVDEISLLTVDTSANPAVWL